MESLRQIPDHHSALEVKMGAGPASDIVDQIKRQHRAPSRSREAGNMNFRFADITVLEKISLARDFQRHRESPRTALQKHYDDQMIGRYPHKVVVAEEAIG